MYWHVLIASHCISFLRFKTTRNFPDLWRRGSGETDGQTTWTDLAQRLLAHRYQVDPWDQAALAVAAWVYSRFGNFTSCKIIQEHTRSCKTRICQFLHCLCSIFHWALHWPRQNAKIRSVGALHGLRRNFGQNGYGKGMEMNGKIGKCVWISFDVLLAASSRCPLVRSWMELNGAGADRFDLRSACIGGREGPEMDEIWIWFKSNLSRLSQGWLKRYHKNITKISKDLDDPRWSSMILDDPGWSMWCT